ncbi:MAG TPA: peptidoglycan-associated lipoprotein Pal [Bryobacteraceae bacterium]|nr:peptidoglycan-associated lipoprotein Pal [Bryobacteraceae bacterium]
MKHSRMAVMVVAVAAMIGVGCAKKKVAAQAPPPPASTSNSAQQSSNTETARSMNNTPAPAPAPPQTSRMPNAQTRARIDTLLARIEDAYFDYDKHTLRPDAITALQADSTELRDILKDYPDYKLTIEGHCDERGSAEYNMALGQERADSAKAYLVQVGIPSAQLATVSYGKEKPACDEHDEACWQKNRRIHIVADSQQR